VYHTKGTTPSEHRFDNLCNITANIFEVPIAAIALVDQERQWFKSKVGLDAEETSRDVSFCGHVVESGTPLTCLDALQHPWFCDNPLVQSHPFIRFYSGCPIMVPGTDCCLGALCIIDTKPWPSFGPEKVDLLQSLAMQAAELIYLEVRVQQEKSRHEVSLARVSHDLRTPLNGILGHAKLLSGKLGRSSGKDKDDSVHVDTIFECGTHLLHLINSILDFTKFSNGGGKLELHPKWFSLRSCIESIFNIYQVDNHKATNGLMVGYSMSIPDLMVEADLERLKQVIINLMGNSLKFTDQGSVRLIIHDSVPNSDDTGKQKLKFEVCDTGRGIEPNRAKDIFKPFVKANDSSNHNGLGLGLANCQMLCEAMGGSIWFTSKPSQGTSFFFELDVPAKLADPGEPFRNKSVLIVSEDSDVRNLMRDHCESLRIKTTVTSHFSFQPLECALYNAALCSAACLPDFSVAIPVVQLSHAVATEDQASESVLHLDRNQELLVADLPLPGTSIGTEEVSFKPIANLGPVLTQGSLLTVLQTLWTKIQQSPSPWLHGIVEEAPFATLRALVVDDNRVNQRVLRGLLERLGVKVETAGNGLEALNMVAVSEYDVVFMDMDMPVMDGLEATKRLKQMDDCPYIIDCSANMCHSPDPLMDDVLPKPVLLEHLHGALEKCVAHRCKSPGSSRTDDQSAKTSFKHPLNPPKLGTSYGTLPGLVVCAPCKCAPNTGCVCGLGSAWNLNQPTRRVEADSDSNSSCSSPRRGILTSPEIKISGKRPIHPSLLPDCPDASSAAKMMPPLQFSSVLSIPGSQERLGARATHNCQMHQQQTDAIVCSKSGGATHDSQMHQEQAGIMRCPVFEKRNRFQSQQKQSNTDGFKGRFFRTLGSLCCEKQPKKQGKK